MENGKQSTQKMIDESLQESFPASDAPAWTTTEEYRKKTSQFVPVQDKIMLKWTRSTPEFDYTKYNRKAELAFKSGNTLEVSNTPAYFGSEEYANSEELFIAAISCCYMQTFLAVASLQGYNIERYTDEAVGTLGKDPLGKMGMMEVDLHPLVKFEGIQPSEAALAKMRDRAHENCFIANSVSSKVNIHIQLEHN